MNKEEIGKKDWEIMKDKAENDPMFFHGFVLSDKFREVLYELLGMIEDGSQDYEQIDSIRRKIKDL